MTNPAPDGGQERSGAARYSARLAAVQAIYQMELSGEDAEYVAEEFIRHRFSEPDLGPPDQELFGRIVRGVPHHQDEIDHAITSSLASGWRLSRVDSILRAILRAGSFELIAARDVPAKVVLNEYVEIAHAFFNGDEPAFINAALDRIAHRKRAVEFGETPPDDEPQF